MINRYKVTVRVLNSYDIRASKGFDRGFEAGEASCTGCINSKFKIKR